MVQTYSKTVIAQRDFNQRINLEKHQMMVLLKLSDKFKYKCPEKCCCNTQYHASGNI